MNSDTLKRLAPDEKRTSVRGRPKVYNSVSERSAAQRERDRLNLVAFNIFREALIQAIARGTSDELTNHQPDEPLEWCLAMASELEKWKLVAHEREEK